MKPLMEKLGVDEKAAAEAIFRTVNANMAEQDHRGLDQARPRRPRLHPDRRRRRRTDPRRLHRRRAWASRSVVVPPVAALYSAFGMFAMDIGQDYARSFVGRTSNIDLDALNRVYAEMEAEALAAFSRMACRPTRSSSSAPPTCAMSASSTRSRSTWPAARLPARRSTPRRPTSRASTRSSTPSPCRGRRSRS